MKIVIKEREVDYDTDYPNGWKFSAGDPFKVPVMINNNKCFVKRFEKKTAATISGWPLLNSLKGKYEPNLPRVYDCRHVEENGHPIHYVFYECIDGKTLEKAIDDGDAINTGRLANDLMSAFRSLHSKQFWFADFCEKNIFCEEHGRFLLVDLDSTEPQTQLPDNEIYGSKDYWIPVYRFYKDILGNKDIRLDDLTGPVLNYLQLPFLILHLSRFQEKNGQKYKDNERYDELPGLLDNKAPAARQLFLEALDTRTPADGFIAGISKMISADLLGVKEAVTVEGNKPLVRQFQADRTAVSPGEPFAIHWQVENADAIELYRNGELLEKMTSAEKQRERIEFRDGSTRDVSYQLIASNKVGTTKSGLLIVTKKQRRGKGAGLKWVAGIAALLLLIISGYLVFQKINTVSDISIFPGSLKEDSIVVIYGKDLPAPGKTRIRMGTLEVPVISRSGDSIYLRVPAMDVARSGERVRVEVSNGKKSLFSGDYPYLPSILVYGMKSNLHSQGISEIWINGKNLHLATSIVARLRNLAGNDSLLGRIVNRGKDQFSIRFRMESLFASHSMKSTDGIIMAGFYQEAAPQLPIDRATRDIRLENPGIELLGARNLSLSVEIDGTLKFYKKFLFLKFYRNQGLEMKRVLDTVILDLEPQFHL